MSSYFKAIRTSTSEKDLSKLSLKTSVFTPGKKQTTPRPTGRQRVSNNIRDIQGMFLAFHRSSRDVSKQGHRSANFASHRRGSIATGTRSGPSSMDHQSMAVRGGSGRFADSSSLTSVETMPSPKTEVRPYRKLSRRRSSLRDRENSIHLSHEPSKTSEDETDGSEDMKNSPNSLKIHDNNENCHDSGFHGIESRLLRRIDDSDDTDSLESMSTPTVTTSAHVVSFQEGSPGLKQTNTSATTSLPVSEKKKQQTSPAPQHKQSEALKTKVSVNQKQQQQQHVGPSQKIVIDVKTEAPQPQPSTVAKPSVTLGPNEKSSNSNGRKAKISAENKIKREISLVLEPTPKKCSGYVGFANLPNQVYRKAVKKGFDFTLMVVGESGLGKSTLINSMFLTDIYGEAAADPASTGNLSIGLTKLPQTLNIQEQKVKLVENDVHLALTVVDTPGFGDAVNNADCWSPVINYVERQFDKYLDAETRVERFPVVDSRVHACLYFIAPTGHTLKPLDIEFMRRIHQRVNIIPVIGKADTLTPEELICFKQQIMKQISEADIKIYQFPQEKAINAKLPFAVVGSNCVLEENGEKIRGRRYPWGVVNIESLEHCDFLSLRDMLIRTHLQDLKERTSDTLYENYRCLKLSSCCKNASHSPIKELEDEKKEHEERLLKMEKEMEEVFDRKVREKEKKLNETEVELRQKLKEAQEKLDEQREDLEEKMAAYDKERLAWSRMYGVSVEELSNWDEKRKTGKSVTLNGVKFRIGR